MNRFGVVQIRVYQNIFRNILTHYIGSELYKYTYTKQNHCTISQRIWFGAIQIRIYKNSAPCPLCRPFGFRAVSKMHIPKLLSLRKHQIKGVQSWTARIYQNTFSHLAISLTGFGAVQKHIYQNDTSTLDDMIIGLELYQKHIYQNMIKGELKTDYGSEPCKNAYTKTELLFLVSDARVRICTARIYQNWKRKLWSHFLVRNCAIMHIPKTASLYLRKGYRVRSRAKTHIPKPKWYDRHIAIQFGAVQILHIPKRNTW